MDRLFLDANVLFSAAYSLQTNLLKLWERPRVVLCSSRYALEEARINLSTESPRERLTGLSSTLEIFDSAGLTVPEAAKLPEKDVPILLGALAASATHLSTGDFRHFGPYFGKRLAGLLVLRPGEYLRSQR